MLLYWSVDQYNSAKAVEAVCMYVCMYVFRTLKCKHFYQWAIYKKCTELSLKKCLQWSMERKYIFEITV